MKVNRLLSLSLVALMVLVMFAGCNSSTTQSNPPSSAAPASSAPVATTAAAESAPPEKPKPIAFSLLMSGWKTWDEPMTADPLGKWIIEKTGVTINVELITGDANEKYALILATKNYPDFMQWPGDSLATQFINQNVFVPYDEHFDVLPNVVSRYGKDIGALYDLASKHMYRISQWSMGNKMVMQNGFNIRHDLMQGYFGDRANTKGFITIAELESFFKDYKSKNPTNAEGVTVYPITVVDVPSFVHEFGQAFGVRDYYEDGADKVGCIYTSPYLPECLTTLNRWYNSGLLDPEFAINKQENLQSKISSGVSIASCVHESVLSEVNKSLEATNPESYMFSYYKVTAKQGQEAYYKYSSVGAGGLCLSTTCPDIDRALSWINFMNDPEVMFYCCNGLPGKDGFWDYNADGKVVPNTAAIGGIAELWDRFRKVGGYKYVWMLSEGVDSRFPAYQGNFYEIIHGAAGSQPKENLGRMTFWDEAADNIINPALFQGITPVSDSEAGIIGTDLQQIWSYTLPEIIMAKDEAAALARYESMKKEMDEAGLQTYLSAVAPNYYAKKDIMGIK